MKRRTDPADGITFVLASSPTALGGAGGGIGYQGVSSSVAIEFDTYNNGAGDGARSNHISIDEAWNLSNSALTNVYGNGSCGFAGGIPAQNSNTVPGCMSNGDLWTATIGFDGSHISVGLNDPSEGAAFTALSNYPVDIASLLGTSTAYVGSTSATGSGWENHDILNWTFADTASLPDTNAPEPTTPLLMGIGLLALLWTMRRIRHNAGLSR